MKKSLFVLLAMGFLGFFRTNIYAIEAHNGVNLASVNFATLKTYFTNTVEISKDAKSINLLSVLGSNKNSLYSTNTFYNPTGPKVLEETLYIQAEKSDLGVVKAVTLFVDIDENSDYESLASLVENLPGKDWGKETGDLTVSKIWRYDDTTLSNGMYYTYVLDTTNKKIYKAYYADGTRAGYRIIKTDDISYKTATEIKSNSYVPSGGYVLSNDMNRYAAIGEIKDTMVNDFESENFELDKARAAVSGKTVYDYLKNNYVTREELEMVIRQIEELLKERK